MKYTTVNLMVLVTLCFGGTAFAAEQMAAKTPSPANQPASAAASAVAPATTTAAPAAEPQPAMKHPSALKRAKAKGPRSRSLDLRHCLELKTNIEIARCAHEE